MKEKTVNLKAINKLRITYHESDYISKELSLNRHRKELVPQHCCCRHFEGWVSIIVLYFGSHFLRQE